MTDGPPRVAGVIVAGVVLRVLAFYYEIDYVLQYRPELTTPLNSLERLQEGLFLAGAGLDPYAGDVFHQPPLVLLAAMGVQSVPLALSSRLVTCLGAILLDVLIALGFASVCRAFITSQHAQQSENSKVWLNHPPLSPLLQPRYLPLTVAAAYLFNPWSLATSLVRSTSLVTYAAIVWSIALAMQHRVSLAICLLAIATYMAVYPVVLLPSLLLMAYPSKHWLSAVRTTSISDLCSCAFVQSWGLAAGVFAAYVSLFVYLSKVAMGGWGFLDATYLWVVRYPDLTPNIGIFWYFFMELFDRFRNYFLFLLHMHPLLYVLPIYLRLHARPLAATAVLLGIFAIFQAYPALGDFGLFVTSLLLHPRSLIGMRHTFVLTTGLATATVLLPLFGVKVVAEFLTATLRRDKQLDEFWKTHASR
ncbi:hypothetical protein SPRG_05886 [Saprolegnia parasitica CBS 223.65]|uniref:GPI transamidase subunit PIG-U n=1 Tax=Saprolegnia parasitica (strain CBS 223.65) TaxID=695850 RepID=A0A067CJI2_SAPPC|nr:hypothetical protein SPRG_05886 [Saprolegnia parasitica CBS 223.65]KDO29350.1 hypothetical protein SPRG_05886 [Saprolegnia parasitica CBS 223.65]|eukprot:XP_012199853.1 hypothetical protein SPRG_05886 [Saprolegnia parasitica CBS 223.65]